jgi:hypothetical protein
MQGVDLRYGSVRTTKEIHDRAMRETDPAEDSRLLRDGGICERNLLAGPYGINARSVPREAAGSVLGINEETRPPGALHPV